MIDIAGIYDGKVYNDDYTVEKDVEITISGDGHMTNITTVSGDPDLMGISPQDIIRGISGRKFESTSYNLRILYEMKDEKKVIHIVFDLHKHTIITVSLMGK